MTERRKPSAHKFVGWQLPAKASAVAPITMIVALAMMCIVIAVFSSAQNADQLAVSQEQERVVKAISDYGEQSVRAVESIAHSDLAVRNIRHGYDADWVHRHIGQRLNSFFGQDYVFVIDAANRYVYGSHNGRRINPAETAQAQPELTLLVDVVRARSAASDATNKPHRAVSLRGLQRFAGQPAIVAASAVLSSDPKIAVPAGAAPVIATVQFIGEAMLREIGSRLDLPTLRQPTPEDIGKDDHVLNLVNGNDQQVTRIAWTPRKPGALVIRNVIPFIAIALGEFLILAGFVLRYMDKATRALAESGEQMRHLALHDPMSKLPNRISFNQALERTIEAARSEHVRSAVLLVDLDHFKDVNDTLGHHVGDDLISVVSQRLREAIREDDMVARLGGDEFAMITADLHQGAPIQTIADRIIGKLRAPYMIMGHSIVIGASIGIANVDEQSESAAEVMRRADIALYRAKNEGRNRACIFDQAMDSELQERKQVERELRAAIDKGDMAVAYQPIFAADGEQIIGVEALCRWRKPDGQEIEASKFIRIAEDSGLIVPLGEWVLRRACLDAAEWPQLPLAVNVSAHQFRRPDFASLAARVLAETGFDPHRIVIELTETSLLGNIEAVAATMSDLKGLGVRFALDDFGTGSSSLTYLRRLPFDQLKVDRGFVRSIGAAVDTATIVHAVVSLGRGLGLKVTAEGVETAEQHRFLQAAGVHAMQGYHFGRPMDAAAMNRLLEKAKTASPTPLIAKVS